MLDFSMSFLNWLSFLSEDKQDTNHVDFSLILPLTVGLGTLAVSVFLGFRNTLYPVGKTPSPVLLRTQDLSKKKPLKFQKPKNKPPLSSVESSDKPYQPAPVTSSAAVPVPYSSSSGTAMKTQSSSSFSTPSISPSTVAPSPPSNSAPALPLTSSLTKIPNTKCKKTKKSKRSSRHTFTSESIPLSTDDPTTDNQWVTVTSKKLRQKPLATVKPKSPETRLSANQVSSSIDFSDGSINQESLLIHGDASVVPNPPTSQDRKAPVVPLRLDQSESKLSRYDPQCLTESLHVWAASSSIEDYPSVGTSPSEPEISPVVSASCNLSTPSGQNVHLSALDQLLSHQLPAQLKAKELECQTLRNEIIRLREDILLVKESYLARLPPHADASTLTDIEFDLRSPPTLPPPEPLVSPQAPQRSPSPDAVLLRTLQDEIARLVKEVALLNRQNTSLENRLETSKSHLSVAKKKASRDTKSLRQRLDAEVERAETAERAAARFELELQESLKQGEIQRRVLEEREHIATQQLERVRSECAALLCQKEQWEKDQVLLESEKERLLTKCDELNSLNQTHRLELECMHRNAEELNQALHEAQSRLNHQLDPDRVTELERSASRLADLETQLAVCKLEAAEHRSKFTLKVEELCAEVQRLSEELDENRNTLADRVVECSRLEDELNRVRSEAEKLEPPDSCPGTDLHHMVAADPATRLETSTQTDPEPNFEFEPSIHTNLPSSELVSDGHVDSSSIENLMDQILHYKSALDKTEAMLSKLQMSVDQEEQRWREALVASKMECELLESKISKLETTLSTGSEERDKLKETVLELQRENQTMRNEAEVPDLVSTPGLMDTIEYDETTPSAELIRTLTWLRHLLRIKDDALEKEQTKSNMLQSKLNQVTRSTDVVLCHNKANGHSTIKMSDLTDPVIQNGRHSPAAMTDCAEMNGIIESN